MVELALRHPDGARLCGLAGLVQRLRGWAELRLSPAEVPRVWLIKDDLPELETGKVDTAALRAELAG